MSPLRSSAGFTLIEVLTALLIFSLVLTGAIAAITQQMRAAQLAEDTTMAVMTADSVVEMVRGEMQGEEQQPDEVTELSGNLQGFSYSYTLEDTELDGLQELTVRVVWNDFNGQQFHEVKTYIAER